MQSRVFLEWQHVPGEHADRYVHRAGDGLCFLGYRNEPLYVYTNVY